MATTIYLIGLNHEDKHYPEGTVQTLDLDEHDWQPSPTSGVVKCSRCGWIKGPHKRPCTPPLKLQALG